jgi:hypothetical protein
MCASPSRPGPTIFPATPSTRPAGGSAEDLEPTVTLLAFVITIVCLVGLVLVPVGLLLLSQCDAGRRK